MEYIKQVHSEIKKSKELSKLSLAYSVKLSGKPTPKGEMEFETSSALLSAYSLKAQFLDIAFNTDMELENTIVEESRSGSRAFRTKLKTAAKAGGVQILETCAYSWVVFWFKQNDYYSKWMKLVDC